MARTRGSQNQHAKRRVAEDPPLVVHGWSIYAYPDFQERFSSLVTEYQRVRANDPVGYRNSSAARVLFAVMRIIGEDVPGDPGSARFVQGRTLGKEFRYWRRAKFFQRFRVFFRYHSEARIIVFVWINDENTLRKAGARTDAYHVFRDMLNRGRPPSEWEDLLGASIPLHASDLAVEDRA